MGTAGAAADGSGLRRRRDYLGADTAGFALLATRGRPMGAGRQRADTGCSGNDSRVWSIDREGPAEWPAQAISHFTEVDNQLWGFGANTIYRLQPDTRSVVVIAQMPAAVPGIEAILPLPDGRILLAHRARRPAPAPA
ncbi:MAG: hypothetical protein H6649_06080 [Caldilineae bacterium]|nr:hypothetical protein [Caldilineae bacterium]